MQDSIGTAGTGGAPVLQVEHLTVRLRRGAGTVTVLEDLNYEVREGEALAIVGESGAGKSVSARAVLDLLDSQRFVLQGAVRLCGRDLLVMPRSERRRYVSSVASLVFQDPTGALNPTMRIGAQIAEAMLHAKGRGRQYTKQKANQRALELLRAVDIADPEQRFNAYPHQLSGGMRQRVVIATAIACQPKLIICDEPTSGLDVTTQAVIMDLLESLRKQLKVGMVLITHDLPLAASRVERVLVMYQGRLVEQLPSEALFEHAAMPYTEALLGAMVGADGELPNAMPTLPYRLCGTTVGCPYNPICPRAQDICRSETPELTPYNTDHEVRCFFPGPGLPSPELGSGSRSG